MKQMLLLVGLAMVGCGSNAVEPGNVEEPTVVSVESEVVDAPQPETDVEAPNVLPVEQAAQNANGIDCSDEPGVPRCVPELSPGTNCAQAWERVNAWRAACERPRG